MNRRFHYLGIVFARSWGVIIAFMALLAFINISLWRSLNSSVEFSSFVITFVVTSLQYALLSFVFFVFASYEMSSKVRRTGAIERLSAVRGELDRISVSAFLILLFPAAIVGVNVFLWHLKAFSLYGVVSARILCHSALAVVLYYLLPACIAILLGIALSTKKRALAYTLIVVSSIAVSPIPLRYYSGQQIGSVSIASVLDWFCLSVPDADWLPDSVYGIPMEFARWVLTLFWILFLTLLILYSNNKHKSTKAVLFVLFVAVLGLGVRFAYRHNDSIIYKDNRINGLQYNLKDYYGKTENIPNEEQATFTVNSYVIELSIRANLKAKVKISVENRQSQDALCFTLHHGMKVEKIRDAEGNDIDFRRDTDYLYINTDLSEFTVCYSGEMGKYYANYQAVYLPGYAAFYPVPGIYHLWNNETNKVKPIINTQKSLFDLKVSYGKTVFSNLEQVASDRFVGESDSIGVFSGLLSLTEKENVKYLESILLNDSSYWTVNAFDKAWQKYQNLFDLEDRSSLEGKMIVFHPVTVLGFYAADNCVDNGDLVYYGDLTPKPAALAYELTKSSLKLTSKNQFLYSWFTNRIYSLSNETVGNVEKPEYNELMIFNRDTASFSEEDWSILGPKLGFFDQLMSYQEGKLGTKYFLKNIYLYLQEDDPEQGVLDFIYYMDEESDGRIK